MSPRTIQNETYGIPGRSLNLSSKLQVSAFAAVVSLFFQALIVNGADTKDIVRANLTNVVMLIAFDAEDQPKSIGSAFFVGSEGELVSNFHLIDGASSAKVKILGRGDMLAVQNIVQMSTEDDLVMLKLDYKSKPVQLGDDKSVEVGDKVVAIGNPEGLTGTVSEGIVSGFRALDESAKLVQITAPISPGSSGGPVFNGKGEVVGMATASMTQGQNLNFAIPASKIKRLTENPALNLSFEEAAKKARDSKRMTGIVASSELVKIADYRCLDNGVKFSIYNGTDKPIEDVRVIAIFYRTEWSNSEQRFYRVSRLPTHFAAFRATDRIPSKLSKSIEKYDLEIGYHWEAEFRVLDYSILPQNAPLDFK